MHHNKNGTLTSTSAMSPSPPPPPPPPKRVWLVADGRGRTEHRTHQSYVKRHSELSYRLASEAEEGLELCRQFIARS